MGNDKSQATATATATMSDTNKPKETKETTVIIDTSIEIEGVVLYVNVVSLKYGPLQCTLHTKTAFSGIDTAHPFMYVDNQYITSGRTVCEFVEDTPAIRAIIQEIVNPDSVKMYTTTQICHKARLIKSLVNFWC